jgi:hypothetical protein
VSAIEIAGRFICEEKRRVIAKSSCDSYALSFAAGEEFNGERSPIYETYFFKEGKSFLEVEGLASDFCGHEDVIESCKIFEKIVGLKDKSDVSFAQICAFF